METSTELICLSLNESSSGVLKQLYTVEGVLTDTAEERVLIIKIRIDKSMKVILKISNLLN